MRLISVSLVIVLLAGCASSIENVQRETARSVGGDVLPDKVVIKDLDRRATSVKWSAETPKGSYACSADDMMRRVLCVKNPAAVPAP
jgi:hypothetical protein